MLFQKKSKFGSSESHSRELSTHYWMEWLFLFCHQYLRAIVTAGCYRVLACVQRRRGTPSWSPRWRVSWARG
ncbi:hypothetical protein BC828DRAFT_389372 [Blastocladiella britannica]|nr:hypothetical protein BC828DRAFT_389372 [Blastocladiella britannica]